MEVERHLGPVWKWRSVIFFLFSFHGLFEMLPANLVIHKERGPVYLPSADCICVWPPGAGSLRAKFELSKGPSSPSTLAVQFMSEGSTLSGVDMELQGSGYRLSLTKKRFATGRRFGPSRHIDDESDQAAHVLFVFSPQGVTWQIAEVTRHSGI